MSYHWPCSIRKNLKWKKTKKEHQLSTYKIQNSQRSQSLQKTRTYTFSIQGHKAYKLIHLLMWSNSRGSPILFLYLPSHQPFKQERNDFISFSYFFLLYPSPWFNFPSFQQNQSPTQFKLNYTDAGVPYIENRVLIFRARVFIPCHWYATSDLNS